MGIFKKGQTRAIMFLSNRTNLTLLQCILYFIIGWIMSEYLSWTKMIIMFIILLGIQGVTRIKAVSDGMVYREIMKKSNLKANEFVEHMKKEMDKINKKDLN